MLCSMWLRATLAAAVKDQIVSGSCMSKMDQSISELTEAFQAGCRLCFVPMPFPYAQVRINRLSTPLIVFKHAAPRASLPPASLSSCRAVLKKSLLSVVLCAPLAAGGEVCDCALPWPDALRILRLARLVDTGGCFHSLAPLPCRRRDRCRDRGSLWCARLRRLCPRTHTRTACWLPLLLQRWRVVGHSQTPGGNTQLAALALPCVALPGFSLPLGTPQSSPSRHAVT